GVEETLYENPLMALGTVLGGRYAATKGAAGTRAIAGRLGRGKIPSPTKTPLALPAGKPPIKVSAAARKMVTDDAARIAFSEARGLPTPFGPRGASGYRDIVRAPKPPPIRGAAEMPQPQAPFSRFKNKEIELAGAQRDLMLPEIGERPLTSTEIPSVKKIIGIVRKGIDDQVVQHAKSFKGAKQAQRPLQQRILSEAATSGIKLPGYTRVKGRIREEYSWIPKRLRATKGKGMPPDEIAATLGYESENAFMAALEKEVKSPFKNARDLAYDDLLTDPTFTGDVDELSRLTQLVADAEGRGPSKTFLRTSKVDEGILAPEAAFEGVVAAPRKPSIPLSAKAQAPARRALTAGTITKPKPKAKSKVIFHKPTPPSGGKPPTKTGGTGRPSGTTPPKKPVFVLGKTKAKSKDSRIGSAIYRYLDKQYQRRMPAWMQNRKGEHPDLIAIDKQRMAFVDNIAEEAIGHGEAMSTGLSPAKRHRAYQIGKSGVASKKSAISPTVEPAVKLRNRLWKELQDEGAAPEQSYVTPLTKRQRQDKLVSKAKLQAELAKKEGSKQRYAGKAKQVKKLKSDIEAIEVELKISDHLGGQRHVKRAFAGIEAQGPSPFQTKPGMKPPKVYKRKDLDYDAETQLGLLRNEPGYIYAKEIVQLSERLSRVRALKQIATNPKLSSSSASKSHTVEIGSDVQRYFGLKGRFVSEATAKRVEGMLGRKETGPLGKAIEVYNKVFLRPWKEAKVVWSPSAMARNYRTNWIMGNLWGDLSFRDMWRGRSMTKGLIGRGLRKEMVKGNPRFDEFRAQGQGGKTYVTGELEKLTPELEGLLGKRAPKNRVIQALYHIDNEITGGRVTGGAKAIRRGVQEYYSSIDTKAKFSAFKIYRDRGMTPKGAATKAAKVFHDYAEVPDMVRVLRSVPMGKPFVTFTSKVAPRLLETAFKRPKRAAMYVGAYLAFREASIQIRKDLYGLTDKQIKEEQKNLPPYMSWLYFPLPIQDKYGQAQYYDLTYELPGAEIIQGTRTGVPQVLKPDDPFFTAFSDVLHGKSAFTSRDLAPLEATPKESARAYADYFYKLMFPSLAPPIPGVTRGGYSFEKLNVAFKGEKEKWSGRDRSKGAAVLHAAFGMKAIPVNPREQKDISENKIKQRIEALEKAKWSLNKYAKGLDPIQKAKRISEFNAKIRALGGKPKSLKKKRKRPATMW
ncbi:hypothetical protein LCGC14_1317460, partial [marine sediment metagenome]